MFDENSNNVMAMVNHLMNIKDSRWLQVEVCREFQRGQCSRTDQECKFAHPPPHVDIQNGKVTACYDSIKGRCTRDNPKCKYLHPPQHLKDQLLINGRNNLALKNLLVSQLTNPTATMVNPAANIGLTQMPSAAMIPGVSAYYPLNALNATPTCMYQGLYPVAASPDGLQSPMGMLSAGTAASPASLMAAQAQQKVRTDRVEALQQQQVAQTVPTKRPAMEKSGMPVYQPAFAPTPVSMAALQYGQMAQLAAFNGTGFQGYIPAYTFAGHPPSVPRF
jgi:hypothetical protein